MAHVDEVKRILSLNEIPLDKIEFCSEPNKYSLLYIGSAAQMQDLKYRVQKAKKTILFIQDASPTFFPAIRGTYFEIIKVIFVR